MRWDIRLDMLLIKLRIPKPIRQIIGFWDALLEEGPYGACDFLAFCFLDDWHVPHRNCEHPE